MQADWRSSESKNGRMHAQVKRFGAFCARGGAQEGPQPAKEEHGRNPKAPHEPVALADWQIPPVEQGVEHRHHENERGDGKIARLKKPGQDRLAHWQE